MTKAERRRNLVGGWCWPELVMDDPHERVDGRPVTRVDLDRLSF